MADFYKSRKTTFISCSHLRFRLCLVLAFLMTMSKTACQNSIWIKFGDCSKNAILGCRTHIFSFFFLRDFFPRIFNTFPMLRFRWNFANVFCTSFPRVVFLGFWIFKIFFEKLQFLCRSGLRKFFRHPYYMVPLTLNTFPMLRFGWNFAHVFSTSFPRLLFLGFWIFKIFLKNFSFFAAYYSSYRLFIISP